MMRLLSVFLVSVCCFCSVSLAWEEKDQAAYEKKFLEAYPRTNPIPTLDAYLDLKSFNQNYLGDGYVKSLEGLNNDEAAIAWGTSYQMMAYNELYRATGNDDYLRTQKKVIDVVMAARDDKRKVALFTGEVAPIWSSVKYSERGRCAYAVHTGIITYPMYDFLLLIKDKTALQAEIGLDYKSLLSLLEESLNFHKIQWVNGPGEGEGYYLARNQEPILDGKALPINRLAAMGRSLWISWKITGNTEHRDMATGIGRFFKNRLSRQTDCDAYVWNYMFDPDFTPVEGDSKTIKEKIGRGEDISHGSLSMSLPAMLAEDGQVFDATDMARFGRTLTCLIAPKSDGILRSHLDGDPEANPDKGLLASPGRWLRLTPFLPEVYGRIVAFELNFEPTPGGIDLALLTLYRKVGGN